MDLNGDANTDNLASEFTLDTQSSSMNFIEQVTADVPFKRFLSMETRKNFTMHPSVAYSREGGTDNSLTLGHLCVDEDSEEPLSSSSSCDRDAEFANQRTAPYEPILWK